MCIKKRVPSSHPGKTKPQILKTDICKKLIIAQLKITDTSKPHSIGKHNNSSTYFDSIFCTLNQARKFCQYAVFILTNIYLRVYCNKPTYNA